MFDITYYDANTSYINVENRAAAIKHVCDNFTKNRTYTLFMIRYHDGYYFNYIFARTASGAKFVFEYSCYSPINLWYEDSSGYYIAKNFSDDTSLFSGIAISSGDDLNDYKTPGLYYSDSSSTSSTLSNMPEDMESGFALHVYGTGYNVVQVIFQGGGGGSIFTRSATSAGWNSWFKFSGTKIV